MHICVGSASLAYTLVLGKRDGYLTDRRLDGGHNITLMVLGTACFWIGTVGIVGSTLSPTIRAVVAMVNTNLAASTGAITWTMIDLYRVRKWSTCSLCSGVVVGLIAISPGASVIPSWAAVVYGFLAGVICNCATSLKYLMRCDDTLDTFAFHAVGGLVGNVLTALFATYVQV